MPKNNTTKRNYLTSQRQAVLDVVREAEEHLTAQEIFDRVRAKMPRLAYSTVYNALRHLKESGLVRELKFGDAASRYDAKVERHDHVVCVRCGTMLDYEVSGIESLVKEASRRTKFTILDAHVEFKGVCPRCR